jgi:hypothetical protein
MSKKSVLLLLIGLLLVGVGSKVWARHGYSMVDDPRIYKYCNAHASITQPYTLYVKKVDDKRPDYERFAAKPHYMYTVDGWWLRGTTFEGQLTEVMTEELRRSSIFQEVTNTPAGADYTLSTLVKHCYGKYQRSAASYAPFGDYAQNYIFGGTTLLVTLKKKIGTVVMQKEYSEEAKGKVSTQRSTGWMYVMLGNSLEKCMERMLKDVDTAMGGKGLVFGQAPPKKKKAKKEKKKKD